MYNTIAVLAEWSKALRSGRSIFGCVGSNPTGCNIIFIYFISYYNQLAHLAQKVERWPFKPMVVGSIPTVGDNIMLHHIFYVILYYFWGISSIGRARRQQRRGTGIETRILHNILIFYYNITIKPTQHSGYCICFVSRGSRVRISSLAEMLLNNYMLLFVIVMLYL